MNHQVKSRTVPARPFPPNRLREWRLTRQLTQGELADRVGTSIQQISRWETGERGLSSKWLISLAKALRCTESDILHATPMSLPAETSPSEEADAVMEPLHNAQLIVQLLRQIRDLQIDTNRHMIRLADLIGHNGPPGNPSHPPKTTDEFDLLSSHLASAIKAIEGLKHRRG